MQMVFSKNCWKNNFKEFISKYMVKGLLLFGWLFFCVSFFLIFVLLVLNACVWGLLSLKHRLLELQMFSDTVRGISIPTGVYRQW